MAAWGNALAAAVGGWNKGKQQVLDDEERRQAALDRAADRAYIQGQRADESSLKAGLKNAGRAIAVDEGAGGMVKPDTMDNSDVGQPENAALPNGGLNQGGYSVAGKAFDDRAAADAAAAAQNSPSAVASRQAAVYRAAGAPDKAMAIESGDRQAQAQRMQLSDQVFKRDLGTAMTGGFDGLAKFGTTAEVGPMAGMNVKAVPTADGKGVQFHAAGPDGAYAPIPGTPIFQNNQNGVTQAGYMLDRLVDPSARMTHLDNTEKLAQAQAAAAGQRTQAQSNWQATYGQKEREIASKNDPKAPPGYRIQSDGSMAFIPGGPADPAVKVNSGKPMPSAAASGLLTNVTNLRRAQNALALTSGETVDGAQGDVNATGMKGMMPNLILNRIDSKGVDTRAAIADLGSLVIHDRSGAAVTASEFPRLAPFIPGATDDPATVRKKLGMFVKNYQAIIDDTTNFYRESGYKVPTDSLKQGGADRPAGGKTPAAAPPSAIDAEMRRRGLIK